MLKKNKKSSLGNGLKVGKPDSDKKRSGKGVSKKVSKKSTSLLISKLNSGNDLMELTSLANKGNDKQQRAFDDIEKHHEQDIERKEISKKVENDILLQLQMIDDISL